MAVPSLGMLMLLCRILYCSLLLNMATQLVFPSGCLGAANIRCVLALLQYQHTSKLQVIPYTMCDVQVMPYTCVLATSVNRCPVQCVRTLASYLSAHADSIYRPSHRDV